MDKLDELLSITVQEKERLAAELQNIKNIVRDKLDVVGVKRSIMRDVKQFKNQLFSSLGNLNAKKFNNTLKRQEEKNVSGLLSELQEKDKRLANASERIKILEEDVQRLNSKYNNDSIIAKNPEERGTDNQRKRQPERYSVKYQPDDDCADNESSEHLKRVDTPINAYRTNAKSLNGDPGSFDYESTNMNEYDRGTTFESQQYRVSSYTYSKTENNNENASFQITFKQSTESAVRKELDKLITYYTSLLKSMGKDIEKILDEDKKDLHFYLKKIGNATKRLMRKLQEDEFIDQAANQVIAIYRLKDKEIDAINQTVLRYENVIKDLESRESTLNDIIKSKERQLEKQNEVIDGLNSDVSALEKDNASLKDMLKEKHDELEVKSKKAEEADELRKTADQLNIQVEDIKSQHRQALEELQAKNERLEEEVKKLSMTIKEYDKESLATQSAVKANNEIKAKLELAIQGLKAKFSALKEENVAYMTKLMKTTYWLRAELLSELSMRFKKYIITRRIVSQSLKKEIKAKDENCERLQSELDKELKINKDVSMQYESQVKMVNQLQAQNNELSRKIEDLQVKERKLVNLKASVDNLNFELRVAQSKLAEKEAELDNLTKAFNSNNKAGQETEQKLKQRYDEKLNQYINDLKQKYNDEITQKTTEVSNLKKKVANMLKLIGVFENDYNQYKKISNEQMNNFKAERNELNATIKTLSKEKEEIRAKCLDLAEDYEGQINKLVGNIKKEKEYIVYLKGKLQSYEKRINTSK